MFVSHPKGVVSVRVIARALLRKLRGCVISVLPRREKPNDSVRLAEATGLAATNPLGRLKGAASDMGATSGLMHCSKSSFIQSPRRRFAVNAQERLCQALSLF
jgi:hypothetical protein